MTSVVSVIIAIQVQGEDEPDVSAVQFIVQGDALRDLPTIQSGISAAVRSTWQGYQPVHGAFNTGADVKAVLANLPDDMLGQDARG